MLIYFFIQVLVRSSKENMLEAHGVGSCGGCNEVAGLFIVPPENVSLVPQEFKYRCTINENGMELVFSSPDFNSDKICKISNFRSIKYYLFVAILLVLIFIEGKKLVTFYSSVLTAKEFFILNKEKEIIGKCPKEVVNYLKDTPNPDIDIKLSYKIDRLTDSIRIYSTKIVHLEHSTLIGFAYEEIVSTEDLPNVEIEIISKEYEYRGEHNVEILDIKGEKPLRVSYILYDKSGNKIERYFDLCPPTKTQKENKVKNSILSPITHNTFFKNNLQNMLDNIIGYNGIVQATLICDKKGFKEVYSAILPEYKEIEFDTDFEGNEFFDGRIFIRSADAPGRTMYTCIVLEKPNLRAFNFLSPVRSIMFLMLTVFRLQSYGHMSEELEQFQELFKSTSVKFTEIENLDVDYNSLLPPNPSREKVTDSGQKVTNGEDNGFSVLKEMLSSVMQTGTPTFGCIFQMNNRMYQASCMRSYNSETNRFTLSLITDDITAIKGQEQETLLAHNEISVALETLRVHKFLYPVNGHIEMDDRAIFDELGVDASDLFLERCIKEDALEYVKRSLLRIPLQPTRRLTNSHMRLNEKPQKKQAKAATFQLVDGSGNGRWYSMVFSGHAGFIFSVDDTVRTRRLLTSAEASISKLAQSQLALWSVDTSNWKVHSILNYPSIFDLIGMDTKHSFKDILEHAEECDDLEDFKNTLQTIGESGISSFSYKLLFLTVRGPEWLQLAASRNEEFPSVFNCMALNITERHVYDEQLRSTQELRDMTMLSGKMAVWRFDKSDDDDNYVLNCDLSQVNMIVLTRKSLEKVSDRGSQKLMEQIDAVFEDPMKSIEQLVEINGRWFSFRGRFSETDNTAVGFCVDITEKQLATIALDEARAKAEAANEAKSVFLANMSHEIRTPLNGIVGMLDILSMHDLSPEHALLTDTIRASTFELMKQLTLTLSMKAIEEGPVLRPNFTTFDMSAVLKPTAIASASRCMAMKIGLHFTLDPSFPILVHGESQMFLQIVNNLLSNALKFTKEGAIDVHTTWDHDTEMATLQVRDTGCGLTEEQQKRLFTRFQQADETIAYKAGGTGLGLCMVQDIVNLLGGTLRMDSKFGVGTTFTIQLPFEPIYEVYYPPGAEILKALVVSKSPELIKMLTENCTFNRYSLEVCESIEECLSRSDARVVFIDYGTVQKGNFSFPSGITPCAILIPGQSSDLEFSLTQPLLPKLLREFLQGSRHGYKAPAASAERTKAPVLKGARVLVVEDNKTNQFVMGKMLKKLECEYEIADNGLLSLDALDKGEFDLVFMDCQMPVMDGLEATRRIRASEKPYSRVPIVALTASAIDGDEEKCRNAGMDSYLAKPVRIQQISDTIEKYMGTEKV